MRVRHKITLDEEVSRELDTIAVELGEKKSDIIEKALLVYFDMIDVKRAKKRLKEFEEGRDQLVDFDEACNGEYIV